MSSQGSVFGRFMSSEDIQSQESNKSDLLASHSNMISEFNSSTNPAHPGVPSKITKLDFANIKQQQQKQPIEGFKMTSNTLSIELKKSEAENALTPEFKK